MGLKSVSLIRDTALFIITLCMNLRWFHNTNSGQLFCNCPRPRPLFGGKSAEGSKVVVTLLLPQMAKNLGPRSALLGENESQ